MTTIVIGTSNPGKIAEIQRFLGDVSVTFQPASEQSLGITIDESGATFEANSELKARAFADATGLPAIATDSGLEILSLDNWPGVKSRRLDDDRHHTDDELITVMRNKIASLPVEQRQYRMVSVVAFACPRGRVITARGEHTGELRLELHPASIPGLPYRRFWWLPQYGKYFNDLTQEEYNQINHNRIALDGLRPAITAYLKEATRGLSPNGLLDRKLAPFERKL